MKRSPCDFTGAYHGQQVGKGGEGERLLSLWQALEEMAPRARFELAANRLTELSHAISCNGVLPLDGHNPL
jgi:hypothetical protein